MTQPYDCVLGYHMNPMTCGIAKFNFLLAEHLGVPFLSTFDPVSTRYQNGLLSIKVTEYSVADRLRFAKWLDGMEGERKRFGLFLHGLDGSELESRLIRAASPVYAGNGELFEKLSKVHADVRSLWCPATAMSSEEMPSTEISVFSFGMAHKVKAEKYMKLKALLDNTGASYAIYVSTALHEGTSFDDSFGEAFSEMREIFEGAAYFLGYLSDQAVYTWLRRSTYFAAFFDSGVRANNTSVLSAMNAGTAVITNLDALSPTQFVHRQNVIDIEQCESLPMGSRVLNPIRDAARELASGPLGWKEFISRL